MVKCVATPSLLIEFKVHSLFNLFDTQSLFNLLDTACNFVTIVTNKFRLRTKDQKVFGHKKVALDLVFLFAHTFMFYQVLVP
jgi:hypothetical protein